MPNFSRKFVLALVACVTASQAPAVALMECTRTTHISHGGQADHADLGEGRVMWRDWWSQEGTMTSFSIIDCAPGQALRFRTAEDNMSVERSAFDRTKDALDVIDRHQSGSRIFATLDRIAEDLRFIARDIEVTTLVMETCACAALYPDLRGDKKEFVLAG